MKHNSISLNIENNGVANLIINLDGEKDGVYFNYSDRIKELPKKWTVMSRSADTINIATTNKWIGYLFHPEKSDKDFDKYLLPVFNGTV